MFSKEIYIQRRKALKERVGEGLILILGNNESPCNYPNNTYRFRQASSFLYYFGQTRDGLVGVIDVDNDKEYLIGDDIDIDDVVWFGFVPSVADLAAEVGVAHSAPMEQLKVMVDAAKGKGQTIHYLPQNRHDLMIQLSDLLGIHPLQISEKASVKLIKAVIEQRAVKQPEELEELERAAEVGYLMHTTAMRECRPGVTEKYIAGLIEGIAHSYGDRYSFQSILSMHGEILHGAPTYAPLEAGRLMLCDAGAETRNNYCSDHTRTTPVSGRFTSKQRDIYDAVVAAHDWVLDNTHPGDKWFDIHIGSAKVMVEHLIALGLMKGNADDAVNAGAHTLFFPHGLGHMMGIDVHDMEGLGNEYVGFDDEVRPSKEPGLKNLRCGRRMKPGFVMTNEPGLYFIPRLIEEWKGQNLHRDFINYDKAAEYLDFGGIRIEDDILITETGNRLIGKDIIPYHADDVEDFMAAR